MTYPIKDENGSWYTLSNGDRVQGKANALEAEAQLGGGSTSASGKAAAPVVGADEQEPAKASAPVVGADQD